jgi:hypothetical protein
MICTNLPSTRPTEYIRAAAAIEGAVLQAVPEVILQGVF